MFITKQTKKLVALLGATLIFSFIAYYEGGFDHPGVSSPTRPVSDLTEHPIYRDYQFGDTDNILDIGIQPLFLPGVISEVMKRDPVLISALAERGIEIRFHSFLKGADINFFLAKGNLEAGIGGDMPTLMACAESSVKITSLIDRHFAALVARHPIMITELEGKRVGYAYGSNAHYALLETLSSVGLGIEDVSMIPMDVNSMPDALSKGEIDVYAAWEPGLSIALSRYPEFVKIKKVLTTGYLYFGQSFAENSTDLTKLLVASQIRAMAWIRTSYSNLMLASSWTLNAGEEIGGNTKGIPAEVLSSAVNDGHLGISSSAFIGQESSAGSSALSREFRFLQSLGEIPQNRTWEDIKTCFDLTMVHEITSQPQQYKLYPVNFLKDASRLD